MDAPSAPRPRCVVVVDDDTRTSRILARMLREDGYQVETYGDGATAIGRLTRAPTPEFLITEYLLPHADGIAVARYALSRDPSMPVIFVTNYAETLVALQDFVSLKAVVLSKPLSYDRLQQALQNLTLP